jgi:hypothetical protein
VELPLEAAIMPATIEYVLLLLTLVRATVRDRGNLVRVHPLLRHQLAVLTRPTSKRRRPASAWFACSSSTSRTCGRS